MNPEIKEKWLAALRSGEYKQTRGALFRPRRLDDVKPIFPAGYCCLGVLCDVMGLEKETRDGIVGYYKFPVDGPDADHFALMPPEEMLDRAMLGREDAEYLAERNDISPSAPDAWDFLMLADWIEECL